VDLQRARLPQTRAKGEYEMENTIKVLQHKVRGRQKLVLTALASEAHHSLRCSKG
jgi:hypothetical protein